VEGKQFQVCELTGVELVHQGEGYAHVCSQLKGRGEGKKQGALVSSWWTWKMQTRLEMEFKQKVQVFTGAGACMQWGFEARGGVLALGD
jgi:hypothetical protein